MQVNSHSAFKFPQAGITFRGAFATPAEHLTSQFRRVQQVLEDPDLSAEEARQIALAISRNQPIPQKPEFTGKKWMR